MLALCKYSDSIGGAFERSDNKKMEREIMAKKNPDGSVTMTVSVRMNVALLVDAVLNSDGQAEVATVRGFVGLPSADEVMEALDAETALDRLDEEFASAPQ